MARGQKDYTEGLEVFFVKIQGLKQGTSEELGFKFEQKNKESGKYEQVDLQKQISGEVVYLGSHSNEHNGKTYHNIVLHMRDLVEGEYYKIQLGFNNLANSLLNSLAGATSPVKDLMLRLYTNEKGYASLWAVADGDEKKLNWKYEFKELQAMVEKFEKKNGEVVIDSSELVKFMMETVIPNDVQPNIAFDKEADAARPKPAPKPAPKEETVSGDQAGPVDADTDPEPVAESPLGEDDLPF